MSSDADKKKLKKTFMRRVAGPSIIEIYQKMDDMGNSYYDMYQVSITYLDEPEGYIEILIWGWENDDSRDYLHA